jgi:hypothetical protein
MKGFYALRFSLFALNSSARALITKIGIRKKGPFDFGREVVVTGVAYNTRFEHMLSIPQRLRDDVFDRSGK